MHITATIPDSLKRLCDLEYGDGKLPCGLGKSEKQAEILKLRSIIPASILGHHDRMLQRGKRSIVPAVNGVCTACHLRLPSSRFSHLQNSQDLEVCDNCSTFIYFERVEETVAPAKSKPAGTRRKRVKESAC